MATPTRRETLSIRDLGNLSKGHPGLIHAKEGRDVGGFLGVRDQGVILLVVSVRNRSGLGTQLQDGFPSEEGHCTGILPKPVHGIPEGQLVLVRPPPEGGRAILDAVMSQQFLPRSEG